MLALGLSGTLIQAVGRNPLADTEILGINSGAALFVVSAIALLGVTGVWTVHLVRVSPARCSRWSWST